MYFDGERWCSRGIESSIFTHGKTLDELMDDVKEATSLHFEDVLEADKAEENSKNSLVAEPSDPAQIFCSQSLSFFRLPIFFYSLI